MKILKKEGVKNLKKKLKKNGSAMKKNNEVTLLEILPKLNHIAKCYGLKLNSISDFRIARTIWARSLS